MRLLFIDGSTCVESVEEMQIKPRGGMVGSLFKVTDYLSRMGHDVSVCSDIRTEGVTEAGTKWFTNRYEQGRYDCLITNRGTGDGYPDIQAKARVLWTHDLPHAGFVPEPNVLKAFKLTVFMSRYAERIWREYYRTIGRSVLIPNGVDKSLFYPREKDLQYLIYMSHPNRGLHKLPEIVEAIREKVDVYCRAYSGVSMYPKDQDARDHTGQSVPETVKAGVVDFRQPLPLKGIAEEIGRAGLMILPTGYPEICSNSVLQALASGTPIITTGRLGSVCEWVTHRKNGMLTLFQPADYMVHTLEIVRYAVEVLQNTKLHRKLINGAAGTKILSWDEVGAKWERMLSLCI